MKKGFFPKTQIWFGMGLMVLIFAGCKKDSESSPDLATVSTDRIENIYYDSAQVISTVSKEGKSAVTGMGVVWGKNPNPTVVSDNKIPYNSFGVGTFRTSLKDLEVGATYYVRSYATNASGTSYSQQKSFSTLGPKVPTISTLPVTDIAAFTALSGGSVSDAGSSPIEEKGICWSTSQNPTIELSTKTYDGTGIESFTSYLTGLSQNTTYYVRAYATNSVGTVYGDQKTFKTLEDIIFNPNLTYGTMSDNDGNTYKTIEIGTQTWMAENLKTTRYRNGNPIPTGLSNSEWGSTTSGAYAIYNNDAGNNTTYGKLYNWYAVSDPRGLCPAGWHVPTDAEWTTLENFLGGSSIAGGKLKSTSLLWLSPNTAATNESGFSGLPGGYRIYNGPYLGIGDYGIWWSSSEFSATGAWGRPQVYSNGGSYQYYGSKQDGFSVRCLRD